jgi:hypothetical protein
MVEIQGRMKVEGPALREPVEDLQKQSCCTDWITREYPERCARYDCERRLALSRSLSERRRITASIASSIRTRERLIPGSS